LTASRYDRTSGIRSSKAVVPRNAPSEVKAATFSNQFAWQTPSYVSMPNPAPVRLDNPAADGQTDAGALLFGGEEGLENTIDFFHRQADACITHRNEELTIRGSLLEAFTPTVTLTCTTRIINKLALPLAIRLLGAALIWY